ncbi:LamG domain-containing protein [Streptomyces sp. NBC_01278]|uniref:LamG domain-containing protein n=1 Tax=Streptomyces sp. NBC_01278 TaxID=2903809 RepID=UPI002E3600E3|nr:LamG domain-containing protein [Streptomyces sp. NBC_01278]
MFVIKGGRLRRAAATALGMAMVAGVASAYTPTAAAAAAVPGTESEQALAAAKKSGKPVEVVGERTDSSTTFANADGKSFRLDTSAVPVRVKAKNGSGWVTPDATLEVRADGSVGPKAAVAGVGFSGGGGQSSLVTIDRGGRSMSWGWQGGPLPKPVLDGDSAVYPEVLPGVDLRMTATLKGFREVLVVKTPEAAKNPKLQRVEFDLKARDVQLNTGNDGGLAATDANGNRVFKAPPALMWDSRGVPAPLALSSKEKVAAAKSEGGTLPKVPVGAEPSGHPADGPALGSQVAKMAVHVDADSLAVVPDTAILKQSDPAVFPLYIDPSVALDDGTEHTALRDDGVSFWNWDNGDDGLGKGMGKCGSWNGYYCGPGYVQRLYFEFSPSKLVGKEVLNARFRVTEPWAFQCDARNVLLVRMDGEISPSTNWWNKPNYADLMGDRWISAGRGSACDSNSPAAPIEFSDNLPDEPDENLTPTVRDFAAGRYNRLNLELRAEDESDATAWKRFRNDAVLSVDYIGKPNTPIYVGLVAGSGEICSGDPATPSIVSDPTPSLTAITETVWGGEPGASLRIAMQTEKRETVQSGGAGTFVWKPVKANAADADFVEQPSSGYVGDNVRVTRDPPATLADGSLYRFRTWTKSFGEGQVRDSAPSGDCYFKVDSTAPKAPQVTFGGPYSECKSTACAAAGKPGTPGQFTFGPGTGDSNTAYQYKLATDTAWTEIAGAKPTASITPPLSGAMRLSVKAKDALGRWGSVQMVDFVVKEGPGPVASWNFDETSGQALDTSTTDPTLQDNADLSTGSQRPQNGRRGWVQAPTAHEDRSLQLAGGQYAVTSKPVIDTRASFTVAGWVRLDRTDGSYSMVSQTGQNMSGMAITALPGQPWALEMATDDKDESTAVSRITGLNPAQAGVWTHVAATYNESTDKARLYVNGQFQGEMTVSNPIASTGGMGIGVVKDRGAWVNHLAGRIDELKAWQDERSAAAVKQDASLIDPDTDQPHVDLAAAWDLSTAGPTFADTSGNGRVLTATAGTEVKSGALVLKGAQAATATGPVVDDTGSFTVTAEAKLDNARLIDKPNGYKAQVIGQRTATGSSWGLWFEKTGASDQPTEQDPAHKVTVVEGTWHFGRLTADGSGTSVASDSLAALDTGVQVTGVHNAQDGTITLYVVSTRQAQPKAFTITVGSGELAVGKGFTNSAWGSFLPGEIKGMRLWSGAMKDAEQVKTTILGTTG